MTKGLSLTTIVQLADLVSGKSGDIAACKTDDERSYLPIGSVVFIDSRRTSSSGTQA